MIIDELFEAPQQCPECGGISFSDLILAEKKDACYYKVKASAKVWPSAYASGRLVQCRKKGAANYGNKSEGVAEVYNAITGALLAYDEHEKNKGVAEGSGNVGNAIKSLYQKIYAAGDDEIEYFYNDSPIFAQYWDEYEGDLNSIIAEVDPGELQVMLDELESYAQQAGLAEEQELDEKWSQKYKSSINCANPKGFSQKAHCAGRKKNESIAEAPLPGQRRDPLDLQPLEGGSAGGGSLGSGIGPRPVEPLPKWTPTRIPGVDVHTGPPPVVTKPPNINSKIDPAAEVPAYVRQGKPDPVTTPVGKPKIQIKPGETMDQAIQRTRAEQEFSNFLKGQGGQSFGTAGGGRGGQGGPTASQATSGSDQVPTIRLPGGKLSVDPDRLSPSGNYKTPATSSDHVGDKEAYNAALKIRKDQWNQLKTGKEKEGEKRRSAWKNPETDVDLEETRKKREQPEANYDDEYDAMVARVKKLAGLGPMKTVYDPNKRQYRNMPTAVQPKVQPKK